MEGLINKAGRQRMLAQRIVKSYVLVASGITPQAARHELSDSIRTFERQLDELKASAADSAARQALNASEREWRQFCRLAAAPCSREGVSALRSTGERLLQTAERATAAFARQAPNAQARLVNLAGRERMLTQRIAKSHLLLAEKYENGSARQELIQACVDFGRALGELRSSRSNTAELSEELAGVAAAWRLLLELVREDSGVRDRLLASAEDILRRMERITSLYEQLAAR